MERFAMIAGIVDSALMTTPLAFINLDIGGFLTGPEILGALAQLVSALLASFASVFLGGLFPAVA
jgi:hypothetical protein